MLVRLACPSDLSQLLVLFSASDVSAAAEPPDHAERIWQDTLRQHGTYVIVSCAGNRIAATCMLITAPNLLRGGCPHGFLDNVVTHPEMQSRGHGRAVVKAALERAWVVGCHHVLMQSGRKDPRVHAFYEKLGFTPGRRTAYVAVRPTPDNAAS